MKYYYFYKITNLINDKVYYGVHSTDNLDDGYIGSGKLIRRAIKKHGYENFSKEILKWFDTEEEMFDYEKSFLTEELIKRHDNYNIAPGGFGGYRKEAAEANRKKRLGKTWEEIYSPETVEHMKNTSSINAYKMIEHNMKNIPKWKRVENAKKANKARQESGYTHSEETKMRMSESNKKHWENREVTDEYRQMISEKTKEAMKSVDWDSLMTKALESRKKYWDKKHQDQKEIILKMKNEKYKVNDIIKHLNVSTPTYYKRIKEMKHEGMI